MNYDRAKAHKKKEGVDLSADAVKPTGNVVARVHCTPVSLVIKPAGAGADITPENLTNLFSATRREGPTLPPASQINAAAWLTKVDPDSGKTYYVNSETRQTQWHAPTGEIFSLKLSESAEEGYPTPAPPVATKKKRVWLPKVDPGSGNTYYVNTATKKSQWDKPADYESAEEARLNSLRDAAVQLKRDGTAGTPARRRPPPIDAAAVIILAPDEGAISLQAALLYIANRH
jgi:hypothetical protein